MHRFRLDNELLDIMLMVWHAGQPVTADDLVRALKEKRSLEGDRLDMLLDVLVKRGYLKAFCQPSRYAALLSREEYMAGERKDFLERLFGERIRAQMGKEVKYVL